MKKLLTVALLALFSFQANAEIPKNAGNALKDVRKRYKSIKTFRAEFSEQFVWQFTGETVERKGKIVAGEGDRFRMESPEQIMVCDGTNLYRYNLLKNQVMIESAGETTNMLPRRLLLDIGSEFEATMIDPVSVAGQEGFRLELKPLKPEESLLSLAVVWITANDLMIRKMQMDDLNGNRTTYILNNIEIDKAVDSVETTLNIPEGAEIFDLR